MEITRQADYAVRAVLHVARLPAGERLATSAIADEADIPLPFLAKIISQLAVSGIVDAMRGARGGVRLARSPEEINLLDVIEAIDGEIALNRCVLNPGSCPFSTTCPIHEVWCDAQTILVERLRGTNFAQLLERDRELHEEVAQGAPVLQP